MTDTPLGRVGAWVGAWGVRPIDEVRAGVPALEEAGYQTLWYSEGAGREAMANGALLLGLTERVTVASGIASIWARDATAMGNGARTLAEAHPGRFVLGIGVSHAPLVGRRGHDYAAPYTATVGYLDAMDQASWRGPQVEAPPVVLAALGPRMLRLSAERAAGAHPYFVPVEHTALAREILGAGPWLAPEQAAVLTTDSEQAREVAREHMAPYIRLPNYRSNLIRLGWDADEVDGLGDRVVDAVVAWGDEEAVAARVAEHLEAGADHVALHLLGHDTVPGSGRVPVDDYVRLAPAVLTKR